MPTSSKRPTVADLKFQLEHEKDIYEIRLEGRNNQIRSLQERVHELTNKGHLMKLLNLSSDSRGWLYTPDNEPILSQCRRCGWLAPVDWDYETQQWRYETLRKIDRKPVEAPVAGLGIRDRWRRLVGGG